MSTYISQYWVGQIPAYPMSITVRGPDGGPMDMSIWDEFTVRLIGSDNEEIDTTDVELQTAGVSEGRFVLVWPRDYSLFEKSGDYLMQLEMRGTGTRDFTNAHNIRVHKLGGVN